MPKFLVYIKATYEDVSTVEAEDIYVAEGKALQNAYEKYNGADVVETWHIEEEKDEEA